MLLPICLFLFNSLLFVIVGKPVIEFVYQTMDLFLLNEAPDFSSKGIEKIELSETKAGVIASTEVNYPAYGDLYGKVLIPNLSIDEPLFFGDDLNLLNLGAGHFIGSSFPGEKGTTLIGGHSFMSGFGKLEGINLGETIEIQTIYGTYQYEVDDYKILNYDDSVITEALASNDQDRLILYTCYPVGVLGLTEQRIFVFASYHSGPEIDENS